MSGGRERTERYMKAGLLTILDHITIELVKVLAIYVGTIKHSCNVVYTNMISGHLTNQDP